MTYRRLNARLQNYENKTYLLKTKVQRALLNEQFDVASYAQTWLSKNYCSKESLCKEYNIVNRLNNNIVTICTEKIIHVCHKIILIFVVQLCDFPART